MSIRKVLDHIPRKSLSSTRAHSRFHDQAEAPPLDTQHLLLKVWRADRAILSTMSSSYAIGGIETEYEGIGTVPSCTLLGITLLAVMTSKGPSGHPPCLL